jgi:amino acid adenylation domain-containing protein
MKKAYHCILIGETSLLIQCGHILLERGLCIDGIISPDPDILAWGEQKKIPCHRGYREMAAFLHSFKYDYLLSIVNSAILPKEILQTARIAAINYHDAPLPKYAGVYATTWALMQGESSHGITWHLMTEQADEGEILIQAPVAIGPDDTVQILNTRCYEQAIRSFAKLAVQLQKGALSPRAQNHQDRSYYGLYTRPSHAGVLRFNRPTAELVNLFRALSYDAQYKNPFATAKLVIDDSCYLIGDLHAGPAQAAAAAGEIIAIDRGIRVATSDGSLLLTELTDPAGTPVTIASLQKMHTLHPQARLPIADDAMLARWSERQSELARYESFWEKRLMALFNTGSRPPEIAEPQGSPVEAFSPFSGSLKEWANGQDPALLAAALHLWLNSLHVEPPRIGLCHGGSIDAVLGPFNLAAAAVPLVLDWSGATSLSDLQQKTGEVQIVLKKQTFQIDLFSRSPLLPESSSLVYEYILNLGPDRSREIRAQNPSSRLLSLEADGIRYSGIEETGFSPAQFIQRALHFLQQIRQNPQAQLDEISLCLPEDETAAGAGQNQEESGEAGPAVQLQIAERARMHPERIAVVHEEEQWSYADLEGQADQVAKTLAGYPEADVQIVAIYLERSFALIAVMLGILKSGAAYLPVAPGIPRQRLANILADAGIKLVITSEKLRPQLESTDCASLTLESLPEAVSLPEVVPANRPEAPAYVIYTSGSTGKPKGVIIGHRALAGFTHDCLHRYRITASDRVLQFASPAFDAAVEEIFPVLCGGGTLVLRTEEMISSIPAFMRACARFRITVLDLPTAFWNVVNRECETSHLRLPECVRLVIIGGESATEAMFASWRVSHNLHPRLVNTYGPTEATVVATAFSYDPEWKKAFLPIGRPVGHAEAFVMNAFGQLLPPGFTGELYLGGTCLALGYLNQEELTRQVFPERMVQKSRKRLYRTGDLVKCLSDGNLLFVGRKDQQVKIRGFRIELSEISSAIASFTEVKECAVIAYGEATEKKLAAYIVFASSPWTVAELRSRLAELLPDYMLPAVVVPVQSIPLTSNMKLDLRTLEDPTQYETRAAPEEQEYGSPLEQHLRTIWQSILNRGTIGLDQDFFSLGGDSLTAVGIMTEIDKQLGRNLPISVMFEHGTLRRLARLLESPHEDEKWNPLVVVKKGGDKVPLFIIHGAGLNVLLFNTLARHLDASQPVYGIQAGQLLRQGAALKSLAEIVEAYAGEITSVNDRGPYAMAGFSIGGLIAYELAQYFTAQGKKVIFVGIFDTYIGEDEPPITGITTACKTIWHKIKKTGFAILLTLSRPSEALPIRWRWLHFQVRSLLHPGSRKKFDPDLAHLPKNIAGLATELIRTVNRHTFLPYPGRIHLFRAKSRLFYIADKKYMGWKKYVADIKLFDIPGDHSYIFAPPNDKKFAETLQQALDEEVAIHAQESGVSGTESTGCRAS